jgi:N-acetylneuraminate synthase
MKIKNREIGSSFPPYIIADISGNHEQNIQKAYDLIDATKASGCDAVKFQTYKPEHLSMKGLGLFKGEDLYSLYQRICMPYEWYQDLFDYAEGLDLTAFTTVFDPSDVEWLEKMGCPAYKISSYEINYDNLLNSVKQTGKPVMISTGCATYSDLTHIANRFSAINTLLFRCVSAYPAQPEQFDLRTIPELKSQFGFDIGLSDHSIGSAIACASIALGAVAVEKHITLSKQAIDGAFALLPDEMTKFVNDVNTAWKSLGEVDFASPIKNREYMRSLYAVKPIKKGELFTSKNIGFLRPNKGLNPRAYYSLIDKKASMDIAVGTDLHMRHVE